MMEKKKNVRFFFHRAVLFDSSWERKNEPCVCGYAGSQSSCLKSSSLFTFIIKVQQRADIIFVYISPT